MIKKTFISYTNSNFKKSAKRLKKEVYKTGIFQKAIITKPNDLPSYLKNSYLFSFSRGGGYWMWKPFVIFNALNNLLTGDYLVYADAGCTINKSNEWNIYFDYLKDNDAIFFQYKKEPYPWGNARLKHWIKKSTMEFIIPDKHIRNAALESPKFLAGAMILKKNNNTLAFIREWMNIMYFRPDLVMDCIGNEIALQEDYFIEHRHDQAVLSALLLSREHKKFVFLPENSELPAPGQAIYAARLMDEKKDPWIITFKRRIKRNLGKDRLARIKKLIGREE